MCDEISHVSEGIDRAYGPSPPIQEQAHHHRPIGDFSLEEQLNEPANLIIDQPNFDVEDWDVARVVNLRGGAIGHRAQCQANDAPGRTGNDQSQTSTDGCSPPTHS
jgi:hypothetical protein